MTQSVITNDTFGVIVAKLEEIVDRELTGLEKSLIDYALIQIQLGLVEVN